MGSVDKVNYILGDQKICFALVPSQAREAKAYCFDAEACGRIMMGMMVDDELGAMLVCKEEQCSLEEDRMEFGECADGPVWLRRLIPLDAEVT